jgi:hypothetical protein
MLSHLQKIIEKIYKVETFLDVENYLIYEPIFNTPNDQDPCNIKSQSSKGCLFISQDGEELKLALYLGKETVSNLKNFHLQKDFNNLNLADFFLATEEISHFIYTVWNAMNNRQISIFEMELQAEVDKYVAAIFYSGSINSGAIPAKDIKRKLFEESVLNPDLLSEEKERYRDANRLAMNYCHYLESNYLKKNDISAMVKDIRRFYRLGQNGKIGHINSITLH